MQNGPNKVDVTPNNTWRNLQLMQIQVDLKWTKKNHMNVYENSRNSRKCDKKSIDFRCQNSKRFVRVFVSKLNFGTKFFFRQNVTPCLGNFLGRQNCEGYVKSLLKSSKVKICLSRSRSRTYIEWRKSRFVTPEKVFRSRNHDVILGSRRFPIYSPLLFNLRLRPINF